MHLWLTQIWMHFHVTLECLEQFLSSPGPCSPWRFNRSLGELHELCFWMQNIFFQNSGFSFASGLVKCHFNINFYTPVWKTDVLCYGNVCPSVRPSFPDFFSTCFEISIWNLVYAFSRWHDMSSLSFITIGSLWPSLQPKVGQTQFLQSWPYKSR